MENLDWVVRLCCLRSIGICKNCPEKYLEFTEKCENWEVVPDILYFWVWFFKENFMMVIRELEMAWMKIQKSGIRILSGN